MLEIIDKVSGYDLKMMYCEKEFFL